MKWIVSLPMYNVSPRLQREYEALLDRVLADAGVRDQVELLSAPAPLREFWLRPDLLLGQTCGYPYMTWLRDAVTLLATPCFDFPGCEGSDYASAIVVREDGPLRSLDDARGRTVAVNDAYSNSGMNVLRHAVALQARGGRFFGEVRWSSSHAASLRMVRDGEADIAAIDCVTYGYLRQEAPESLAGVRVLRYTAPSPGLPLICSRNVPAALQAALRRALLKPGAALREHMHALHIDAFQHRGDADYQRISQIEAEASAAGYPALA